MPRDLQIVSAVHPFQDAHEIHRVRQGATLSELIAAVQPDSELHQFAIILLDGDPVPYEDWKRLIPAEGQHVLVQFVPMGGGGKDPLRTILTIGLIIAAATFTGPLATNIAAATGVGAGVATGIASGIFLVGGNFLLNAIAPIRKPVTTSTAENIRDAPNFYLDDARNRRRAFYAIPMVLGTHRMVPPLGAKAATEVVGDKHYLRMIVVWGHGVLTLDDIRIGETPITDFEDVQIEHREGRPDDEPLTIYTNDVEEDGLNILLQQATGWYQRTSAPDADELSIDVVFPKGLRGYDELGNEWGQSVKLDVAYRKVGTTEWLAPDLGGSGDGDGDGSPPGPDRPRPQEKQSYGSASSFARSAYAVRTEGDPEPDPTDPDPDPENPDPPDPDPPNPDPDPDSDPNDKSGRVRIFDNRNDAVRHGFRWRTPERAQYDVRVRRVTRDSTGEPEGERNIRLFNEVYWLVLRTITDRPPVDYEYPLAVTALSIRASDQLHGAVDELNAIVSCEVLDWNGTAWVKRATSNPASLFRHVLQMEARVDKVPNREIDLAALQRWHRFCEQNGYEYNAVRDYHSSVWDTLSDIAAVGRASPIKLENGKWSVVVDDGRQMPVQVFTPRNSSNFRAQRHFEDIPDGFRVRFANRARGWRYEERRVFQDGYTDANATRYATIDAPGITDANHVYKFARFHLAQLLLRREQWEFETDFESLVVRRGSRVLIAHDVLVVGEAAGRIKEIRDTEDGPRRLMKLDTELEAASDVDYGVTVRTVNELNDRRRAIPVERVENVDGDANLIFESALDSAIRVGDLVAFGTVGRETVDGLVTAIRPRPNQSARVSVVPWSSPGVYRAETGPIPPYDPGFGDPDSRLAMTILRVRSDESTRETEGGVLVPRVVVEFDPVAYQGTFGLAVAECQIREAGVGDYRVATIVRRSPGSITIGGVTKNQAYDLRLRWRGIVEEGPWAYELNHVVSAGVFGFPGDSKRGLAGFSSIITRATLVASAPAADTDTEWHLSGGRDDWTGARTLTLGGIDADEEDRLSRTKPNTIVTIYADSDNWADYLLQREVTFAGTAPTRVATISLVFVEEVGTPPADGADMALHFSPVGTVGIAGKTWYSGRGVPPDSLGEDEDFYLRTADSTIWQKANGTWTQLADLSGADGAVWHTGEGAPPDSLGQDGHWYFRTGTDAAEIYEKVGGTWVKQFDIDDGLDGTIWRFGGVHPDANTTADVRDAPVGSFYFLGISGEETEITYAGEVFPDGAVFERKAADSVAFPDGTTGDWLYIADMTGPQGVPGVRGLSGYSNVITRTARASTLANLNSIRWHLTGTNSDWIGNRVFTLGGVTADKESLLSRINVGALVTLYSDDGHWYDYTLFSTVSFTGSGTSRTSALSLVPVEGRGAPPASGAIELHFTADGRDGDSALPPPDNVRIEASVSSSTSDVIVRFDLVPGAASYRVRFTYQFGDEDHIDPELHISSTVTSASVIGIGILRRASGPWVRRWAIEVYTVDDAGIVSGPSEVVTATPSGPSTTPTDLPPPTLTAVAGDASVVVTWPPVPTATFYEGRHKRTSSSSWGNWITVSSPRTWGGLANGVSWDLQVRAARPASGGGTDYSDPATVTRTPSRAPAATTVTASAGGGKEVGSGGSVTLDGGASVSNGSGFTSYRWRRISGTGGSLSSSTTARPTFTAPTLTAGGQNRAIVWELTATNNGVSDSDRVTVTVTAPPDVQPPPTPTMSGSASYDSVAGHIDVTFQASATGATSWELDVAATHNSVLGWYGISDAIDGISQTTITGRTTAAVSVSFRIHAGSGRTDSITVGVRARASNAHGSSAYRGLDMVAQ